MLERFDVARLRAENPGPLSLTGTNTWLVERDPCWVVDPGPLLEEHLAAVLAEAERRGGIGGIAVTHDHADHVEGLEELRARAGAPPVATSGCLGPLRSLPTPGHSPDSVTWLLGCEVAFTGDTVLGDGSVFVMGQLGEYLDALRRLRALDLQLICPGHGPPVTDPAQRLDGYLAHRLERERKLVAALDDGARTVDALLDAAWADAPPALRLPATVTLAAHLEKLEGEGRLPDGVERPAMPDWARSA